jgi:hypothetical protein
VPETFPSDDEAIELRKSHPHFDIGSPAEQLVTAADWRALPDRGEEVKDLWP